MKVILIKNAVETLGYFSEQLAETFQEMGHDTYFVDYDDLVNTVDASAVCRARENGTVYV